jgi:hypothetical protein
LPAASQARSQRIRWKQNKHRIGFAGVIICELESDSHLLPKLIWEHDKVTVT